MAVIVEGKHQYSETYVVELDEGLYGPFVDAMNAASFALERFDPPYTIRPLLAPLERHAQDSSKE